MNIPTPKMPTSEQMQRIATDWWQVHEGINMLEWNDELKKASFPFVFGKIPPDMAEDMVNGKDVREAFVSLLSPVLDASGWKDSFFVKLITRSPKDYLEGGSFEMKSLDQAYEAICCSMRTLEDLCMLIRLDKCYVIFRPFIDLKKECEFRVLVYGRQIVGISQYHYFEAYDSVCLFADYIEGDVRNFVNKLITPNVPVNHYVADLIRDENGMKLIEINPFGLSDPCLFNEYKSLDGTFKYIKTKKEAD